MDSSRPQPAGTARLHLIAAVCFFVIAAGTIAVVDLAARNEHFGAWIARQDERHYQKTGMLKYDFSGSFLKRPDQFLYQDLPRMDFSRGGVYFMGPSNVVYSTKFWELPPDQRAFIHNCGLDASCHTGEFHLLRYMIEQRGMLAGGGGKNLVIFGSSFHSAGDIGAGEMMEGFLNVWQRQGLFKISRKDGIEALPVSAVSRFIRIEKLRMAACLDRLQRWVVNSILSGSRRQHDHRKYIDKIAPFMGPDWQEKVDGQLEEFGRMLDYLRSHGVQVVVILMPLGSWDREMPFAAPYNQKMMAVCKERNVLLKDWSNTMSDEEFGDATHLNLTGMAKFQKAFLEIALPFMQSVTGQPQN